MKVDWILVIFSAINAYADSDSYSLSLNETINSEQPELAGHTYKYILKNESCYSDEEQKPVRFLINLLESKPAQVTEDTIKHFFKETKKNENCAVFTIHGLQGNRTAIVNKRYEYWDQRGCVFIMVEWDNAQVSYFNFKCAFSHLPYVGKKIAEFIDSLIDSHVLTIDNTYLIGFSLGAHVAGLTGRQIKNGKLPLIVGLDPSGPCMDTKQARAYRINAADASYVECIVTSVGSFSIDKNYCTATFVVNAGLCQPSCASKNLCGSSDIYTACNHYIAVDLFVAALKDQKYISKQCSSDELLSSQCNSSYTSVLMADPKNMHNNVTGVYAVPTDDQFQGMLNNSNAEYESQKKIQDPFLLIVQNLGSTLLCPLWDSVS